MLTHAVMESSRERERNAYIFEQKRKTNFALHSGASLTAAASTVPLLVTRDDNVFLEHGLESVTVLTFMA